jgi:flagellar basal body-associated protein FliL
MNRMILAGGLAIALSGGGGTLFLGCKKDADNEGEVVAEEHEAPAHGEKEKPKAKESGHGGGGHGAAAAEEGGAEVVAKQDHVVNLPGAKAGFLRCQFSFIIRDEALGQAMTSESLTAQGEEAKAIVLEVLQGLSVEDMQDNNVRSVVVMDIKEKMNDRFGNTSQGSKEPIKEVFITGWAIQR